MNQMGSPIEITAQGPKGPPAGGEKDTKKPSLGFVELLGSCCAQVSSVESNETVEFSFGGKSCELELNMETEAGSEGDSKLDCAILARKLSMNHNDDADGTGLAHVVNPEQVAEQVSGKGQNLELKSAGKSENDPTLSEQIVIQKQGEYPLIEDTSVTINSAALNALHAGKIKFKHSFGEVETASYLTSPMSVSASLEQPPPGFGVAWDRLTVLSPQQTIIDAIQRNTFQVVRPKHLKSLGTITSSTHEDTFSAIAERQGMQMNDASRASMPLPETPQQGLLLSERVMRFEDLASRFSEQLLSMVKENQKAMRITIEPASLGRLTVLCREENAAMTVEIHSQNESVRDLIARQEDAIRRMMQDNNIDLGKFNVLMDQGSAERQEQRQLGADRREKREQARGIQPASKESGEPREKGQVLKNNAATWIA